MFELTAEQYKKLTEWELNLPELEQGSIGGGLTYEFTPTSIGVVLKVYFFKDTSKQQSIDLSDYENW